MLQEILPQSLLNDKKISAIVQALEIHLRELTNDSKYTLHLPRLDELPHEILNLLADQYHVDFFEPTTMNLETKRQLVRQSILQHFKYGTKAAVENLLRTLSSDAQISEWFEYGGEPYHFKVGLTGLRDLEDDGERIIRAIETTKNVRSWIDAFDFNLHSDTQVLHVAQFQLNQGKINCSTNIDIQDTQKIHVAQFQIVAGNKISDIDFTNNKNIVKPRAGFINITAGRILYGADFDYDPETFALWLNWLKFHYKKFNLNPVIKFYRDEDDIFDDDFNEDEFSGNFIKLFFNFKRSDESRLVVLPFPRDDINGADVNSIPAANVLLSRRGYRSDKIYRAVLVKKTITKLK